MNTQQAKQLSMPYLLSYLGFTPIKEAKGGRELWYRSPFREEKDPSFHISIGRAGFWIWKDFADAGGTIIDFVMRYKDFSHIGEALTFLDAIFPNEKNHHRYQPNQQHLFSFHQQSNIFLKDDEKQLEFIAANPIKNPLILTYLEKERGIPKQIALRYIEEVKYKNLKNGKEYFAFGMKNLSDGYEIRAASNQLSFKSALIAKDISIIKGSNPTSKSIHIFEGMTDFLSFLVFSKNETPIDDCLIMHSLSSFVRATDFLQKGGYQTILTYLDNNKAGLETTDKFKTTFENKVVLQNHLFAPHTDLNDALIFSLKLSIKR